jgi:hypothetical protein
MASQKAQIAVSAVPALDGSIGNPAAYSDPKSNASMAAKLQAMGDQLQSDRSFDAPPAPRRVVDGYQDMMAPIASRRMPDGPSCYRPNRNSVNAEVCGLGLPGPSTWISQQMACQKPVPSMALLEGYADAGSPSQNPIVTYALVAAGAALLLCVFMR